MSNERDPGIGCSHQCRPATWRLFGASWFPKPSPQVPPSVLPLGLESSPQLSQLSWWAFSPFKAVRPAVATDISLSCHLWHSWEIEIIQNMDLSSTTWLFELAANTAGLSWGAGQGVDRSWLGEKGTSLIRRTQHKLLLNDSHVSSITSSLGSLLIFILHVHRYLLPREKYNGLQKQLCTCALTYEYVSSLNLISSSLMRLLLGNLSWFSLGDCKHR